MDEILELVKLLNTYRDSYYNDNISLVSDKEYDLLFDKLVALEKTTGIVFANSPTATVGYTVVSKLKKVKHNHPLLSLNKTTEIDEFSKYFEGKKTVVMAKMDGLTCSLTYKNGELVLAESRGDGHTGEDITHNALTFVNIPKKIPYNGELVIDGECIIDYETFDKINTPLIEKATKEAESLRLKGKEFNEYIRKHSYANPRNLASGSVRQLDSNVAATRELKFIAWKLHESKDVNGEQTSYSNFYTVGFRLLHDLGFEIVPHVVINAENVTSKFIEENIESIRNECKKVKYPIDGAVGTFDDVDYGLSLGATGHHPKHSYAFKFYQENTETILEDIEWSTSRTGLVNPVAIVEPVEIDGTIVSRATLSNVSIIKDLQLGIGDKVTMIKANQIIPKITNNLTRSDTYIIPTECPCCKSTLITKNDNGREMLYCTNNNCLDRKHDKISNFACRDGMNIVGISDERLKTLMKLGFITDFESLYFLERHRTEIEKIDGFGKTSVDNLLKAINESKNCKFVNVLVAIGIPGIGKSSAKSLAKYCAFVESNTTADKKILGTFIEMAKNNFDWTELEDVGEVTSNGINQYVKQNVDELSALIPILNIIDDTTTVAAENIFGGKTFCITGKLIHFSNREALVEEIEKYGGKVVSSVTAKTNYLITNDKESGSSKNKKAEQYGTSIISEEEFIQLCKK